MEREQLTKHLEELWQEAPKKGTWLSFGCGLALGIVVVVAITWEGMPAASVGLLGVLLGASISAAVGFVVARDARRAQIASVTWAKRLEAHQKAFALWHQCWNVVHEEDTRIKHDTLKGAEEWWLNNCLYLSEDARNAFQKMIKSVTIHSSLLSAFANSPSDDQRESTAKALNKNWDKIVATGRTIMEASALHVSEDVVRSLGPANPRGH